MKNETKITVSDGIATFEDGTQIRATVELIAAAPELLDLLRTIIRKVDAGLVGSENWYVWDKARVAIAKVEGRTS